LVNPQIDGTLLYIYIHILYIYTWLDGMFKNWHVIFSDGLLQDKRSLDLAVGAWKRLAWPRGRLAVHPSSWSLGKIPMVQGTASPFCWHIYMSSQYMDMYIYICDIYVIYKWYMIYETALFFEDLTLPGFWKATSKWTTCGKDSAAGWRRRPKKTESPKKDVCSCVGQRLNIFIHIYILYTNCC
jgi:hypothetical protein